MSHGLKWQVINIAGKQLLSFFVFTTLARLLDPASFGLLALISVYTYFASMLADLGLGAALVQRKNVEREHLDTAFWFNVGCNLLLCIVTMAVASPLATMMGEPDLAALLRWSSLSLVIAAASSVQGTLFVRDLDFRRPAIRNLIANAVGGAVGVGMAFAGFGVWALVGQLLSSAGAGAIFISIASPYRPQFAFSFRHLRELLAVGSSVFANALIWFFASRLEQLVIGRVAGVPTLGIYVIASKLPELTKYTIQQPLVEVAVPALAKLRDDHPRMREAIYTGVELHAFVIFPVFVGIASIAEDLVPFLFGSQWSSASSLCALLSIYALVGALQLFFYPALLASGVTGKYVSLNLAQTVGVFCACIIGIQFGVTHLVIGLIVNSVCFGVCLMFFLRRQIGLDIAQYCKPCVKPAVGSVLMAGTLLLLSEHTLALPVSARLVAHIVTGVITYILFALLFAKPAALKLLRAGRGLIRPAL